MSDTLDALTAELQNYIVAPLNAFGVGGFVFSVEAETIAHLSADITDHYTEDNRALQDHIAIRPKRITLKGYVGEVVNDVAGSEDEFLQQAVQKLTELSSFLPILSASATQLQQTLENPLSSDLTLSSTSNIYGLVKNVIASTGNEAKQQAAYNYFKAVMTEGILMGVQTPWEFMTNMAIENITAIQPEGSIYVTDFSVTLKQIRIAQTITGAYANNLQGQNNSSSQNPISSLSPLDNQAALAQYRVENNMQTPPIDIELQGAAAIQAQPPIPQGNVPGVSLPTLALPGYQSQILDVNSFMTNQGVLSVLKGAGAQ